MSTIAAAKIPGSDKRREPRRACNLETVACRLTRAAGSVKLFISDQSRSGLSGTATMPAIPLERGDELLFPNAQCYVVRWLRPEGRSRNSFGLELVRS